MNSIEVFGLDKLTRDLQAKVKALENVNPLLDAIGIQLTRSVQKNFQAGGRPPWKESRGARERNGKTLSWRGVLKGSISHAIEGRTVLVGTNVKYGRIQQLGGVVRPKKAKALAIPLNEKARKASENLGGKTLRDIPDMFFLKSKTGKSIGTLMKKTKKGKAEAWFALMESVAIPKRPFLVLQPEDHDWITKRTAKYVMFPNAA
jgi:phage gpG-like protein